MAKLRVRPFPNAGRPRPTPSPAQTPTPRLPSIPALTPNTFTLTTNIETLPFNGAIAPADTVFTAPASVNLQGAPTNTLQSGDVLNGSGQQNILNTILTNTATIVPTINNVPTINITSLAPDNNLNLGASAGIDTIGDINSTADVTIISMRNVLTNLNKTAGISRKTAVIFQNNILTDPDNAVAINLDGIDGGDIRLEAANPSNTNGYETFNVSVIRESSIGRLISGGSLDNIIVTGANLSIGDSAGFDALERQLINFNASAQLGSLTIGRIDNGVGLTQGASVINASAEDLNFVGSNGGSTLFVESASLAEGDVLNGGAGQVDNLVLTGAARPAGSDSTVAQANNNAFTATGFEILTITDTAGNGVAERPRNNPTNFNLANVAGINTLQLGTASNAVVGLSNLQYTSPLTINVSGNGELSVNAANGVNANFFGAFGDADTVNYSFSNKGRTLNSGDNLNNGALTLQNIEVINLSYNDLSSNTTLKNPVFDGGTNIFRFARITATSGEDDRTSNANTGLGGAIQLGEIGAPAGMRSVRGGEINSAASVSALFNNRDGSSFLVSGAGEHNINVENISGASSTINAGTATGDVRLSVEVNEGMNAGTGSASFTGGLGDDILRGGAGDDLLTGNIGNDNLRGFNGSDVLSGGDNRDLLEGGVFADLLTGGAGADLFLYEGLAGIASDTGITLATADVITDFSSSSGDQIVVRGSNLSGTPTNYGEAAAAIDFAAARGAANNFFATTPNAIYYLSASESDETGLLFINTMPTSMPTQNTIATDVIQLRGVNSGNFTFTDIVDTFIR